MAIYYVATTGNDTTGNGSIGSPWATVSYAMSSASPVAAGDTVYVRGGIYNEKVTVYKSGASGNPITLSGYPTETAILDGSRQLTGWQACTSQEDALGNANWKHIYKTSVSVGKVINSLTVYENGSFMFLAQEPNQTERVYQEHSLYMEVPAVSDGLLDGIVDPVFLVQADDYWNGCTVFLWSQNANSVTIRKKVADFVASENKIYFDSPLTKTINSAGTKKDRYSLANHIDFIDKAGEYCYIDEGDNNYTVYCWPENVSSITNGLIRYSYYNVGIIPASSGGLSYFSLRDIEIRGFATQETGTRDGGINNPSGFVHSNFTIDNVNVHECAGSGISLSSGTFNNVLNCTVANIRNGNGIGVACNDTVVHNNTLSKVEGTGIAPRTAKRCRVSNNTLHYMGTHGNGVAVYTNCEDVLIANNYIVNAGVACTISTSKNITLYNNVFYTTGITGAADWGGMSGFVRIINNTIQGAGFSYGSSASVYTIINNILAGGCPEGSSHLYNAFTAPAWYMTAEDYNEGEFIQTDETQFFIDYANLNFDIKEGSPSINAGTDVSSYLPVDLFPDFDFELDVRGEGRTYDGVIDLGAYEYSGSEQETPTYVLNSFVSGTGTISSNGLSWTSRSVVYTAGETVSLTANEIRGTIFNGWTGDVVSNEDSVTITMNSDKTIVASFVEASLNSFVVSAGSSNVLMLTTKRRV